MVIVYEITSRKGAKMLECVFYIFLSGATMLSTNCVPYNGVYYPDRVEYVQQHSPPPSSYYNQRYTHTPGYSYYPYNYWYSNSGSLYYNRTPRRSYYRYPARRSYKRWGSTKRYRPKARHIPSRASPPKHKKKGKKWKKR